MNGDWFYTVQYDVFDDDGNATLRSAPENITRWIITQSRGFKRIGIRKVIRSAMDVYLFSSYFSSSSKVVYSR